VGDGLKAHGAVRELNVMGGLVLVPAKLVDEETGETEAPKQWAAAGAVE
jgi:hypothetical protein